MKQIICWFIIVNLLVGQLYGGTDLSEKVSYESASKIEEMGFIKTVDGYLRAGYQADGDGARDLAFGGKLHVETNSWNGISAGASFYTTHAVGDNDGAGVPFFDANNDSYSILGEAYIQGAWGNTLVKVGRQEIDTPFLDTDDIGMVPNTYEAMLFINKDIKDVTITLAHIEKMAGVDAEINPAKVEDVRDNDYVQLAGLEYSFSEKLAVSGWYYKLKNPITDNLVYTDVTYINTIGEIGYEFGAQYAHRNLSDTNTKDADIYGAMMGLNVDKIGISLGIAYNTAHDNFATNGFGGGPFYTSSEHLTLREANADGNALLFSAECDAGIVGFDGFTLLAGYLTLKANNNVKSDLMKNTGA